MADTPMQVELVAADRLVWSGEATMVIARTAEGELGVLAQDGHHLRLPQQQVGRVPAAGQHPGHPAGDHGVVPQQPQVPGRVAEGVADLVEPEQPGVGAGRVGEPAEHHRQQGALDRRPAGNAGGERLDMAQRPGRIGGIPGGGLGIADQSHHEVQQCVAHAARLAIPVAAGIGVHPRITSTRLGVNPLGDIEMLGDCWPGIRMTG